MKGLHYSKYLSADIVNEQDDQIEEGVYTEPTPDVGRDFKVKSRYLMPSYASIAEAQRLEEAQWAARSGPVRIIRPARGKE